MNGFRSQLKNAGDWDRRINSFAYSTLRDTADQDYVAARLAYRDQLLSQYLWSAEQALEKYLKCILQLNRIRANAIPHELEKALDTINANAPFAIALNDNLLQFIRRLDGSAKYRYLQVSQMVLRDDLILFDRCVWSIRRYCQSMDYEVKTANGKVVNLLESSLQAITDSNLNPPQTFHLIGGKLESILANRKHPARKALLWGNFYFGARHRSVIYRRSWWGEVISPLEYVEGLIEKVEGYVRLESEVKLAYKTLRNNEQ